MGKRAVVERRASERLPLSIVVFIRGIEDDSLDLATVLNLSATGALIRVKRYAGPNMEVSITFPAPPADPYVSMPGQNTKRGYVVRASSSRLGELWGVRFDAPLTLDPQRGLAAYKPELTT